MAEQGAAQLLLDTNQYNEVDPGIFVPVRPTSETWQSVEGGWLCFYQLPGSAVNLEGGLPWGRELENGSLQVPYKQSEEWKAVGGVHPATHPQCFDWIWPEERIVEIYAHASPDGDNPWRKTDEGDFVKD